MPELMVEVTRVINAPIKRVFSAWVEPQQMKQWYSPEGMTTPAADTDAKKDGHFHVTMAMGQQSFDVAGTYLEYDEPHKLVFTWERAGAPSGAKPTIVAVLFKPIDANKTK